MSAPPSLQPHPSHAVPPPRGWWQRNWKWAVPVLVLTLIALVVAFFAAILFAVRGSMMHSDVYTDAVARARANPELVALLGEPLEPGFMPSGSVSSTSEGGGSGKADLAISLEGPRGGGQLVASAERRLGNWIYESLVFMPEGGGLDQVITIAAPDTPVDRRALSAP